VAGLVPAIHVAASLRGRKDVDARDKRVQRVFDAPGAGMTAE